MPAEHQGLASSWYAEQHRRCISWYSCATCTEFLVAGSLQVLCSVEAVLGNSSIAQHGNVAAPRSLLTTLTASTCVLVKTKYTTAPRTKEQEAELQQQIDELHKPLQELGLTRKFVERIAVKRFANQTRLSTAEELRDRITTLWDLTHSTAPDQQQALLKRLYHIPQLLNLLPATLRSKAVELEEQLQQQLGLPQQLVQHLLSTQPSVLMFRPELIASKMQAISKVLGIPEQGVCNLWLRNRSIINMRVEMIDSKVSALADLLHVERADVAQLITTSPSVLASSMETIKLRADAYREFLGSSHTREELGRTLVMHGTALTYKPDTIRYRCRVMDAYCQLHPSSREQLDERKQRQTVINLFARPAERVQLLEYIIQTQGSKRTSTSSSRDVSSSGSSSTKGRIRNDRGVQNDRSSSSSVWQPPGDEMCAKASAHLLVDGLPLMVSMLGVSPVRFQQLVNGWFPGFWEWQQEQQK